MARAEAQRRKERRKNKDIIRGAARIKSITFCYSGCICGFNLAALRLGAREWGLFWVISISRAYYASYQAMWSALGEPQDSKIWRHLAIIKHFVRGYWFKGNHSKSGPGLLEDKRLPLRRLYALRIKSDYDCIAVRNEEVDRSIKIVSEIIEIIKGK